MNRVEIKEEAKKKLTGNYWNIWKATLIIGICSSILAFIGKHIPVLAFLGGIASFPLSIGLSKYYLALVRGKEFNINMLFSSYKDIIPIVIVSLLVGLFTVLWSFLLVIPGIIAAYSYSQVSYLLADEKNLSNPMDIIKKSKELTNGYKMDLFIFHLSFLGWIILSIITCGLAFIYVIPYYQMSLTLFYEHLRKEKKA